MGVITFNYKVSTDYGIEVEKPPKYVMAEENAEVLSIPGRNGDLFYSNKKSYKNVERSYDISFYNGKDTMEKMASKLYEFLHSANGYARLEDSYNPDVFRLAYYVKKLDLENILFYAGRGKIEFNCKPQRFLKSGEAFTNITSSSATLTNPTTNNSAPLLRVTGTGVVGIGSQSITISAHSNIPYIYIDCETMDAYYGATNCNPYVTFGSVDEVVLVPGQNNILLGSGITNVRVAPRWWIL